MHDLWFHCCKIMKKQEKREAFYKKRTYCDRSGLSHFPVAAWKKSGQDLVEEGIDFVLGGVGMDMEVRVTGEHGGQLRLSPVVEDVAGDAAALGVGQLIAHAQ